MFHNENFSLCSVQCVHAQAHSILLEITEVWPQCNIIQLSHFIFVRWNIMFWDGERAKSAERANERDRIREPRNIMPFVYNVLHFRLLLAHQAAKAAVSWYLRWAAKEGMEWQRERERERKYIYISRKQQTKQAIVSAISLFTSHSLNLRGQ